MKQDYPSSEMNYLSLSIPMWLGDIILKGPVSIRGYEHYLFSGFTRIFLCFVSCFFVPWITFLFLK